MITYQEEQLKDFIPEFDALLRPHMSEINMTERYGFEFKPEYKKYIKQQESGFLYVLTCRNDAELIGYINFFKINNSLPKSNIKLISFSTLFC